MNNFTFVSHNYEISSEIKIVPQTPSDKINDANTDIVFNIKSYSTDSDNNLKMNIIFQLTYMPKGDSNKYLLALNSNVIVIDHNRNVEQNLFSAESIRLIANFYRVNGEYLLKELASQKSIRGYNPLPEELIIDMDVAVNNTKEIMLSYKQYLESLN
ncbi:hypothetical protein [Pedobacter panaciterrae]